MPNNYDLNSHCYCSNCNAKISNCVRSYSFDFFQIPLCEDCQVWYRNLKTKPSIQARRLFFELKEKGLDVDLEYDDGYKSIDIFSKESMMHIEVDGNQHYENPLQALSDLLRTMYSNKEGYHTLRLPNALIERDLKDTANIVYRILIENKNKMSLY